MLKISRVTLWRWMQDGLPAIRPSGHKNGVLRFRKDEVLTWASKCACTSPAAGEVA